MYIHDTPAPFGGWFIVEPLFVLAAKLSEYLVVLRYLTQAVTLLADVIKIALKMN